MPFTNPPNAAEVRQLVETRLDAWEKTVGVKETVTIEWRDNKALSIPVISIPVGCLHYNPETHRLRAQRSMDPQREQGLLASPYSPDSQLYLQELLRGDPTDPSKEDPEYAGLRENLDAYGQKEPGIITRTGVVVNGNTRLSAMIELGQTSFRAGVLPPDTGYEDIEAIELALQMRKTHRREYSFMNLLIGIEERVSRGLPPAAIQAIFQIRSKTYERNRWIFAFVKEAITRSTVEFPGGKKAGLRLMDFEEHKGRLDELYRAYMALRTRSEIDQAEALKEQRLLALILDKSKTDLRLIDPDFAERHLKIPIPEAAPAPARKIPGTPIVVPAPAQNVQNLRQLTTNILQAKVIASTPAVAGPEQVKEAGEKLAELREKLEEALAGAGKQARVRQRRIEPADRISDAGDDVDLAIAAIAKAKAEGAFQKDDLYEALGNLREKLERLALVMGREPGDEAPGFAWLHALAVPEESEG